MDNLFIVRSPLQIINALEAIEYFHLKDNILVIIYNNTDNTNLQMDKLIKLYKWKEIIYVNEKKKKSKYFEYIAFTYRLKKRKYNYLFFSNLGSIHKLLLANIKRKHTYYIDDGVETLSRYNDIFLPNRLNQFTLRQMRFLLAGLNIYIKDNIHFFTYFDLKDFRNSKIVRNDLHHFQKKYFKDMKEDTTTYILGQALVSLGFLEQEYYFQAIDIIVQRSKNKIVYIPHRTEKVSSRLQNYVSKNFEIRDINMPVELYFLENKIYPHQIISFITTAFFTLKKLYPKTKMAYIYISQDKILKNKKAIEDTYKSIEKLNIEKIDID